MGIFCAAFAVSDATLETIRRDPLLVWQVVEHDDPNVYENAVAAANRQPLWARLWSRS